MLVYAHVSMYSADAILCSAAAAFAHLFERDVLDATSGCKLLARIGSNSQLGIVKRRNGIHNICLCLCLGA